MRLKNLVLALLVFGLLGAGCVHEDTRSVILRHFETGETIKGTVNFTTREAVITLPTGEILKGELSETINLQAHAELNSPKSKLTIELMIGLNANGEVFGEARTNDGRHFTVQL